MAFRFAQTICLIVAMVGASQRSSFSQASDSAERQGGLYLKDSQVPKGYRVVGFEIHLGAGAFESIDDIPSGWHFDIDNEPLLKANLTAHANSGSYALNESDVQQIWIQITKVKSEDEIPAVWGRLTLISDSGAEKQVGLSAWSFQFVERYGRHRLR